MGKCKLTCPDGETECCICCEKQGTCDYCCNAINIHEYAEECKNYETD